MVQLSQLVLNNILVFAISKLKHRSVSPKEVMKHQQACRCLTLYLTDEALLCGRDCMYGKPKSPLKIGPYPAGTLTVSISSSSWLIWARSN